MILASIGLAAPLHLG